MKGYDWQAGSRNDMTSTREFRNWFFLHIMTPVTRAQKEDKSKFDLLSDATDCFQNIDVTMQVNGIEIDVSQFCGLMQWVVDQGVEAAAKDLVIEKTDYNKMLDTMDDLQESLRVAMSNTRDHLYDQLEAAGVKIYRYDDD